MPNHLYHITESSSMLVDSFHRAGHYSVVREAAPDMPASVYYRPSRFNEVASPAAVLFPGYREDVLGRDLSRVSNVLHSKGYAVCALNYGGLELLKQNSDKKDEGTLKTHIEDLRTTLSFVSASHVVYGCTSNGINSALQVMSPNVSRIFTFNPFPNFIEKRVHPIVVGERALSRRVRQHMDRQGFFILPDNDGNKVKFTQDYIDRAIEFDAFLGRPSDGQHTPRIDVINMCNDAVVEYPPAKGAEKPQLVRSWVGHMIGNGYDVRHHELEGDAHHLTDPVYEVLERIL